MNGWDRALGAVGLVRTSVAEQARARHVNAAVDAARQAMIEALSLAARERDNETEEHSTRVTQLAVLIATKVGVSAEEYEGIRVGALMHDLGKIGVPDNVLLKPGPLNEAEWAIMKTHPVRGWELLRKLPQVSQTSLDIVRHHHEHWDGSGYPDGLKGEQIPVPARIFAVADAYDALRSDRPYRAGLSHTRALEIIDQESGTHFCPTCMYHFVRMLDGVESLYDAPAPAAAV